MRLTAIIILSACLTASASGGAQTVSLNEKAAPLGKVLEQIRKQTGYTIFYEDRLLQKSTPVTISIKNATLQQVLDLIFRNQPLSYEIIGGKIIAVKEKPQNPNADAVISNDSEKSPPIDVTGKVTDENGNPLSGATVKVKGTSKGTTTNNDGVFVLKGVDENAVLEISYVGFETYTVSLSPAGGGGLKAGGGLGIIALKIKPESLNEVIVNKGYYTEKQKLSVSNVGRVTAKDIEKQPVANPLLALQGRVSGIFITQNTGMPGGGVTVRIQGQNSMGKGNDPLYVIDGVPYVSQMLSTTKLGTILGGSGGNALNGVGNPLNYINPSDIESIDILKDADATAIYGSRAANGAILITTKKGRIGQTKVEFNIQNGWGKMTRRLDLLNTQEYLAMRHEALTNDGATPNSNADYDLTLWDTTRNTDWQKVFLGGTASFTNVNGSISGGTPNLQYVVGATYYRETTVFPGNFSDKKGSVHFNLNNITANKKFRFQLSGSYLADINDLLRFDLTNFAVQLAPNAPALYKNDGTLNWMPTSAGNSTWINPLRSLSQEYDNKTYNLIGNAVLRYQILKGLDISSSFGYTNLRSNEFASSPLSSLRPESRATGTRTANYSNSTISSFIIEPQINYKGIIGKGQLEILLGTSLQQNNGDGVTLAGSGYNSDIALKDIRSASTLTASASENFVYKYNALFGRVNYNWKEKYIVNLAARRDGSSRFGPQNLFHNFGSIGAAWIFSEENYVKSKLPFVSFGKVRANYGTTGNDQIGDYQFMDLYSPYAVGRPYQGITSLTNNSLNNPYLEWEETRKLQLGIDLGFLSDRILLSANYANNKSSNQLLPYQLPIITGFGSVVRNFPATVKNTSWEFTLRTVNLKTKNIEWTTGFNLTVPDNRLVSFPNLASSPYASSLIIGQPINISRAYDFLGVDPTTGLYIVSDSHGNATANPDFSTDRTILINTLPKFYGGFQNTVSYKGFQADFLFQFVKQVGRNYLYNLVPGSFNDAYGNQPVYVLNRWRKAGDATASVQRFSQDFSTYQAYTNAGYSTQMYSDASFIRLKNIQLSWLLSESWRKKIRLQNCKIYLQCQNLFTLTKYKGLDPETQSSTTMPPLRVLTFGVQLGL